MCRKFEKTGFVLIGRKENDYYFAQSVFEYGDGYSGVTGCVVSPVSQETWDWCEQIENVEERVGDIWEEMHDSSGCEGYADDEDGCEVCGYETLRDFAKRAVRTDGIAHIFFDGSYGCDAERVFNELGVENVSTDCSACGRIFGNFQNRANFPDFDETYNVGALVAILALEDGAVSAEYAAQIVFGRNRQAIAG